MAWDPKTYLAFGSERTRPAAELLSRIACDAPRRVADLGCGPGNSTALLAQRWPDADIEGVDSSAEMLETARRTHIKARWVQADVAFWRPATRFDVVYSNATYQWLPDHAVLLPKLVSHVEEGGIFAFQIPRNFGEPSHTIIRELASKGAWADKLANVGEPAGVLSPEEYFAILEPLCSRIDIWETRYLQTLQGEDAVYNWVMGTALRPYANALVGSERDAFLGEYRTRVAQAYPTRKSGVTLFPFLRLFCVAQK